MRPAISTEHSSAKVSPFSVVLNPDVPKLVACLVKPSASPPRQRRGWSASSWARLVARHPECDE